MNEGGPRFRQAQRGSFNNASDEKPGPPGGRASAYSGFDISSYEGAMIADASNDALLAALVVRLQALQVTPDYA